MKSEKIGMSGLFKIEAIRPDGTRRLLADWFPNLITDIGLNQLGVGGQFDSVAIHCRVGTSSTAPANSDTALGAQIASTNTQQSRQGGNSGSAPWYGYARQVFRFAAGVAAGNLNEVGVGWASTGATLFSRSLIKDGGGTPVTITVLADEILDVTYELRAYAPTADTTATITVDGVSRTFTIRAATVGSWSIPAPIAGGATMPPILGVGSFDGGFRLYDGAIGAVTGSPAGADAGSVGGLTVAAYVTNSLERVMTYDFTIDQGNNGGSNPITSVRSFICKTNYAMFQWEVTPTLAKDNTKTLSITMRFGWARRP